MYVAKSSVLLLGIEILGFKYVTSLAIPKTGSSGSILQQRQPMVTQRRQPFLLENKEFKVKPLQMISPFEGVGEMYKQSLDLYPLETKLVTGAALAYVGDYIAQVRQNEGYDTKRATSFVIFDMLYRASQCAAFPIIIEKFQGQYLSSLPIDMVSNIDTYYLATLERTLCNQLFVIPFFYYPLFFTLTGYIQGLRNDEIVTFAKQSIGKLLVRNWAFWIPVQYFQFGYVDENFQIPFLCLVGLVWTLILSLSAGSTSAFKTATTSANIAMEVQLDLEKNSPLIEDGLLTARSKKIPEVEKKVR